MTPESLSGLQEDVLGGSRHASVLEDGARVFDLADSKYSELRRTQQAPAASLVRRA